MAIDLVNTSVWNGVRPTVVVSTELGETGEGLLVAAGLTRTEDRILAVTRLAPGLRRPRKRIGM